MEHVEKIIVVSGGKGGIGKSTFSAVLALNLSQSGYRVGLMDLDFWGPSAHIMLGARKNFPKEHKGIVPPSVNGVKLMSIVYYTKDKTLALRKSGFDHAVVELFAVTQWGPLDYLIIDMPPGIGDAVLDVIRCLGKAKFCIIMTSSKVVMEIVKKTVQMLKQLKIPILGIVRNMKGEKLSFTKKEKIFDTRFLGDIHFDRNLERAIGYPQRLLRTDFAKSVGKISHHF